VDSILGMTCMGLERGHPFTIDLRDRLDGFSLHIPLRDDIPCKSCMSFPSLQLVSDTSTLS
jgi:hypothetical protein